MRYSKTRRIITAIVSVFCIIIVASVIIKGIDFAKKANGTEEKTIKTSVTENKVSKKISNIKKKVTKKTTKEEKKETKKTTTNDNKKTVTKTETKKETKTETKKENNTSTKTNTSTNTKTTSKRTFNKNLVGKYKISQLIIGDKDYTEKEIEDLKKDGHKFELELKSNGIAFLSALDTNGIYEFDNDYFYDGTNKIEYSKNTDRIRIKIGNKNMLFIKE